MNRSQQLLRQGIGWVLLCKSVGGLERSIQIVLLRVADDQRHVGLHRSAIESDGRLKFTNAAVGVAFRQRDLSQDASAQRTPAV